MRRKYLISILLLLVTLLGGFLRLFLNTQNPPSLNGDEISFGYSAYSILQTGRDEYGKFLPLTLQSVGDFKSPLPAYIMIPTIAIFGLNDFAVRFPNALFGTLTIPIYFLFLKFLLKDQKIALLGAFFLAVSAWHIFYSRFAYEYIIASFFALLGIWSFMRIFEGSRKWAFGAALFLVLTMYTAPAARLFIMFFIFAALVFKTREIKRNWSSVFVFILSFVILAIPIIYATFFLGAGTRLGRVFIYNDIDFSRYILLKDFGSISDVPSLIFFWLKRYLNYLQPDFLFFSGLNMTSPGNLGLGLLYLFELPWLILGIGEFIKLKIPHKAIILIWLLTGIIPDSLTNNQQHSGRLLQIVPVVILFTTLGAIRFYHWVKDLPKLYQKVLVVGSFSLAIVLVLAHAFLTFVVHFPIDKNEAFDEGLKEVAIYATQHKDEYDQIVIDPRRGVLGPYLISTPFLYVLFYSKYDPHTYQTEAKIFGTAKDPNYQFNKYAFRYINWSKDRDSKGTLFIGSPWSFSADLPQENILKKVYLSSGDVGFLIVTPKSGF